MTVDLDWDWRAIERSLLLSPGSNWGMLQIRHGPQNFQVATTAIWQACFTRQIGEEGLPSTLLMADDDLRLRSGSANTDGVGINGSVGLRWIS